MLNAIKKLFVKDKDYAGRSIDDVIAGLAKQSGTPEHTWSYLAEEHAYENVSIRQKIYPHERASY